MKIYTRGGDKGDTSLIGGGRVPKHHLRIQAYGSVDELLSWLGLLRDYSGNNNDRELFIKIQENLMVCSALLAADCEGCEEDLPEIGLADIEYLEREIDRMEEELPPLRKFILPGGNPVVSVSHICRTVCRRAERDTSALTEQYKVDNLIISYLNRLSDFLFVYSRYMARELNAEEIPWNPKL